MKRPRDFDIDNETSICHNYGHLFCYKTSDGVFLLSPVIEFELDLKHAKKLQKWLDKAIKYMEKNK